MIDIKRRKVKAIYHNAFCCPECGLELHRDNIVLTTYPVQYCYFCDCGFRTTSSQLPGYEVEFEDEDLPSAYPEKIVNTFCEIPFSQIYSNEAIVKATQQTYGMMMEKEMTYV